jgi:hypothetical protein
MTSALNSPLIVSAKALSYESPTLPTDGEILASANRSVHLIDRYWADSIGRRNTFDYILFEQLVESFGGSSPAEGFAWSCVQSMRDRAQLIHTVLAEIRALIATSSGVGLIPVASNSRQVRSGNQAITSYKSNDCTIKPWDHTLCLVE